MGDLRAIVRDAVFKLEKVGPESAATLLAPVKAELEARGLPPDCHCGRKDLQDDPEAILEWYAGQGVSIVESESWFAMNSWINCVDKFAPEKP